jgi:hypothetical protein
MNSFMNGVNALKKGIPGADLLKKGIPGAEGIPGADLLTKGIPGAEGIPGADLLTKGISDLPIAEAVSVADEDAGPVSYAEALPVASAAPVKKTCIDDENAKNVIRKAYRDIIDKQETYVLKEFEEGLQHYIKKNFTEPSPVDSTKLKESIEEIIIEVMQNFFRNISNFYLQYEIIKMVFTNKKTEIITALQNAINNTGLNTLRDDKNIDYNTNTIINNFKTEIDNILKEKNISRGGGNECESKLQKVLEWFPANESVTEVNDNIKYIVIQAFVRIMNTQEFKRIIYDQVAAIFPTIHEQIKKIVENEKFEKVDMAILRSYIDLNESETLLQQSIRIAITNIPNDTSDTIASNIYTNIMKAIDEFSELSIIHKNDAINNAVYVQKHPEQRYHGGDNKRIYSLRRKTKTRKYKMKSNLKRKTKNKYHKKSRKY